MKSVDAAWAAGFLDGEGCFTVRVSREGHKLQPVIHALQKSRIPLERLQGLFGGVIKERRGYWYWVVTDACTLIEILPVLIPHLTLKQAQATLLLELCDHLHNGGNRRWKLSDEEISYRASVAQELKDLKIAV